MTTQDSHPRFRVLIAGGGVAALETLLALRQLAPDRTAITVIAPNSEFVYRPMTVQEPFAYSRAHRYQLEPMIADLGAELFSDELAWIDPAKQLAHTAAGGEIEYDALMLALGANARPRYE